MSVGLNILPLKSLFRVGTLAPRGRGNPCQLGAERDAKFDAASCHPAVVVPF